MSFLETGKLVDLYRFYDGKRITLFRPAAVSFVSLAAAACISFGGTSVAMAQDHATMADLYEPAYPFLQQRLSAFQEPVLYPRSVYHKVENISELPVGTKFLLETDSFASYLDDGLLKSEVISTTGTIIHSLGSGGSVFNAREGAPREYVDRVAVRVIYPDGSEETVQPHSVIVAADVHYYSVEGLNYQVKPGTTATFPLRLTNGDGIPEGSKVVADRHGSIEGAELKGADIDIDENTGTVTVSFPADRRGTLWFRTELFFPDGTYTEVHYTFEITDTPQNADNVVKSGSSLSSS